MDGELVSALWQQEHARQVQELSQALQRVRMEEHDSLLGWTRRVEAAAEEGRQLQSQVERLPRYAPGQSDGEVAAREAEAGLLQEAAALRAELESEAARERELEERLARSELQAQRMASVTERTMIVQRAVEELQRLHSGLARRAAELEAIRNAALTERAERQARLQAQHEERLDGLRRRIAAERAEAAVLRSEIAEEQHQERVAQEAELQLLAAVHAGGGAEVELRVLRQELAASERRGAGLAALLARCGPSGPLAEEGAPCTPRGGPKPGSCSRSLLLPEAFACPEVERLRG